MLPWKVEILDAELEMGNDTIQQRGPSLNWL